jgi:hypothetical protein
VDAAPATRLRAALNASNFSFASSARLVAFFIGLTISARESEAKTAAEMIKGRIRPNRRTMVYLHSYWFIEPALEATNSFNILPFVFWS